jgi:hypothetical protein
MSLVTKLISFRELRGLAGRVLGIAAFRRAGGGE